MVVHSPHTAAMGNSQPAALASSRLSVVSRLICPSSTWAWIRQRPPQLLRPVVCYNHSVFPFFFSRVSSFIFKNSGKQENTAFSGKWENVMVFPVSGWVNVSFHAARAICSLPIRPLFVCSLDICPLPLSPQFIFYPYPQPKPFLQTADGNGYLPIKAVHEPASAPESDDGVL